MQSLLLTLGLASLVQGQSNWTIGQTVLTSSGPIRGHKASLTSVSEYLGIPFAKPPVGDLRWAAPVEYTGNVTINGTSFGFSCPANTAVAKAGSTSNIGNANITAAGAQILASIGQIGEPFSEDCLTVNVWTKPQVGETKKAVLVWIYGGGFSTGSSRTAAYNGQYIADQEDVVVVSFNYRLNVFGFPGSTSTTQNLGLLDQRLAVEWIRDNIPLFGGDSSRITLFGQSAGGGSIDYYSFAWVSDPIVAGFIPQSGSIVTSKDPTPSEAAIPWFAVAKDLGCGDATASGEEVLKCMRGKNTTSILTSSAIVSASFGPVIDEVVVFSDYLQRATSGNFTKRPLLIGHTDYEGGLYATLAALSGTPQGSDYWMQWSDSVWTCPISARANVSISHGVPTWRYRYFGVFPNTRLTSSPESGAYHASELPVLFNSTPTTGGAPQNTVEEIAIGKYMRGAWAAFAKDPVNGLKGYGGGWPEYVPGKETLIRLAFNNQTGTNVARNTEYEASCNTTFLVSGSKTGNGTGNGTVPTSTPTPTNSGAEKFGFSFVLVLGVVGFSVLI